MQPTPIPERCVRCGRPVRPGEPVMWSAAVDLVGGRAVASPVRTVHLADGCREDDRAPDAA